MPYQRLNAKFSKECGVLTCGQAYAAGGFAFGLCFIGLGLFVVTVSSGWPVSLGTMLWAHPTLAIVATAPFVLGGVFWVLGAKQDQIRRHLVDLERARAAAEAANQAKDIFLGNVSHELRTPLNGVLGMLEVMQRGGGLTAADRDRASIAQESGEHLLALLDSLLNLTQISTGEIAVEDAPLDPADLLRSVCAMMSPAATAASVALTHRTEGEAPAAVLGDARRLRQILLNLVNNAMKFAPGGAVGVTLSCAPGLLRFTVQDDGPGVPADLRERVFERFVQADGSETRTHGGIGLGLAICQELTEAMGGEIRLEDAPRGARFVVELPLRVARPAQPAVGVSQAPEPTPTRVRAEDAARPLKVLVVDDHDVNVKVAGLLLEMLGQTFAVARNGLEAVQAVRDQSFDLVLMDIQMPVMDGISATREIRGLEPGGRDLPIIALTASASEADEARYLQAGLDGLLSKPLRPDALQSMLARVVESRAAGLAQNAERPAPPLQSGAGI